MQHFWGNLTDLRTLDLADNVLVGGIPPSLGLLSSLSFLGIGRNNLSGLIPVSLWNMSSLTAISVQRNALSGTIPSNAFDNTPRLQYLLMDRNQFHGPIPGTKTNASSMIRLQLDENFFGGIVPPEVGSLRNLIWLHLAQTLLVAKEPKDWEFLTALSNCSQLLILALAECKFEGVLPDSISNLSTSINILYLEGNRLSGSIPKDIGNLINLQMLHLHSNLFTSSLPSSLCWLQNLVLFYA